MKSKDSKHQDSEKVDMFRDNEFSRAFIKKNIETIVKGLAKQVKEPEDSYREVLQNCIDSDTPQIDVYYNERPAKNDDEVKLDMIFEDYGCGMDYFERDEFFLKLFKSNKKHNKRKIGKYGIGICSVFLLGIDEFYVESCGMNKKIKEKEPWHLYIKDIKDKPNYVMKRDANERKGTKIILTKTLKKDEVDGYKAKAKAKMKYFCKRSRTPIYVEKDFINEEFDIDSAVKSYKSLDDLEFVMAVTHDQFYELHNNRLLLEEYPKAFFRDWKNVSVLISSYNLRHTFERDSVVKDKNFEKIKYVVRKEIKTLFSKALEKLADYTKNPIPVFREICPEIIIDRGYMGRTISTIIQAQAEEKWIKSYSSMGIVTTKKERATISKIAEFKKQFYEYTRKKNEFDNVNFAAKAEEKLCWDFVVSYMDQLIERAKQKRDASYLPLVGGLFKTKEIAAKTKSELPAAAYEHKIIPTINGHISIGELVDAFTKQKTLLTLNAYNPELQKLLDEQNELVLFYNTLNRRGPVNRLVDLLGDTENAAYKYIVQCKIEDESIVGERENGFLKKASKMLKSCYGSYVSDIYFTNHLKLGKEKINNPIILVSKHGRIEIEKSKKKLTTRLMNTTKDIWSGGSRYDFALNLDSEKVQKMITTYHSKDKNISNMVFIFLKSEIENNFPWLKASINSNSSFNSTNYQKYSNAGLGIHRGV